MFPSLMMGAMGGGAGGGKGGGNNEEGGRKIGTSKEIFKKLVNKNSVKFRLGKPSPKMFTKPLNLFQTIWQGLNGPFFVFL
jgi:hypothetical protein